MTRFVLDTDILRDLAHGEPPWFATLVRMRRAGHHFSIHDIVTAELTAQMLDLRARNALGTGPNQADFNAMCDRMNRFLDPDMPMWPGRNEMIPLYPDGPAADTTTARSYREKNRGQFLAFTNILRAGRFVRTEVTIAGERWTFGRDETLACAPDALQTNRNQWMKWMRSCEAMRRPPGSPRTVAGVDRGPTVSEMMEMALDNMARELHEIPDARARLDLATRYFVWYQHAVIREDNQINPGSRRRKNDGIDVDLPFALFYDCIVVTEDTRFLANLVEVESPQKVRIIHIDQIVNHA